MLRSVIILIMVLQLLVTLSVCVIIFSLISPGENKIHRLARPGRKSCSSFPTRGSKSLVGNVLTAKPQIFMANLRAIDIRSFSALFRGSFDGSPKKELFKIPFFGHSDEKRRIY